MSSTSRIANLQVIACILAGVCFGIEFGLWVGAGVGFVTYALSPVVP